MRARYLNILLGLLLCAFYGACTQQPAKFLFAKPEESLKAYTVETKDLKTIHGFVQDQKGVGGTWLFYHQPHNFATQEPIAVYRDGQLLRYCPFFDADVGSRSLAETIEDSYTSTRYKSGAVCRDGTRSISIGSGTCSHHGGVKYWTYTTRKVPLPDMVICYLDAGYRFSVDAQGKTYPDKQRIRLKNHLEDWDNTWGEPEKKAPPYRTIQEAYQKVYAMNGSGVFVAPLTLTYLPHLSTLFQSPVTELLKQVPGAWQLGAADFQEHYQTDVVEMLEAITNSSYRTSSSTDVHQIRDYFNGQPLEVIRGTHYSNHPTRFVLAFNKEEHLLYSCLVPLENPEG